MKKHTYKWFRMITLLAGIVFAGGTAWGQSLPFEVTTADDITNNTEKLYWIESAGATGFYAVPHSNNQNASTTNTPTLRALWYFMESGENGYYYIINKETGKYLKKTGNTGADNTIGVADHAAADDDKFKFSFDTPQGITEGSWVVYPKEAGTAGWLSKKSGNLEYGKWLKVSNWGGTPVGDLNSQWKIVARDAVQWPQSGLPFVVSTSSDNRHYYRINHAQSTEFNISYDGSNYVTISNVLDNKIAWYFEEAASDPNIDNLKYYYIVNASSEKYLKFTATTINGSNQDNQFFSLSDYSAGDADRFQFVVVNSYGGNAGYSIMPKLAMSKYDVNKYANSMIAASLSNGDKLDLRSDRNNSNAHWNFVSTVYPSSCSTPTITYSSETGKITITSTPADAEIHYTYDGTTEPTSSVGTLYSDPFDVTTATTIKAIATKTGYDPSEVATVSFSQVETPTIQNNGSNAISITCATTGATIYYTTDGGTPNTSSTPYTGPLTENVSGVTIKAIAVKDGMINSAVSENAVTLKCAKPIISKTGDNVTISCAFPASEVTIRYTINGGDPTESSAEYESPFPVNVGDVIKAIATAAGYENSEVATKTIREELTPGSDGKYHINNQTQFETFVDMANTEDGAQYHYFLDASVTAVAEITEPFIGTFDGNGQTLTGLTHALFNTVDGGVVKNVMLDNVSINQSGNVGAICNEATGAARIYNCGVLATGSIVATDKDGYTSITSNSSTISGSGYVGGIVGQLNGEARVINCFSYADITGGAEVGGIVGHNNVATSSSNLKTMVMNCMYYGDITGGTSKAPIYNGEIITNDGDASGVNNFNYFRAEASYVQNQHINVYNCALAAETRFLQRFEFFRHLLNSNRELAAWWITGNRTDTAEVMKWVMEPSQIGSSTPYPILKQWDKYPSVVNYSPNTTAYDEDHRCQGRKLTKEGDNGVLHVTIQMGDGAVFNRPAGASIHTPSLDLTITDKDTAHFNYNYGKVQLPYYNDVGTKNYNGNRVVAGWKIVDITSDDRDTASYSTGAADVTFTNGKLTATPYNFADRYCTKKDLYGTGGSNRVFNQGAYWDVPVGVTAITIQPYWAKAVYLADASADTVYKNSGTDAMATPVAVPTVGGGTVFVDGNSYPIAGENQVVYTSMGNAIATAALYEGANAATQGARSVYDYAVVLVGNYHHTRSIAAGGKPYTVTSIDLNGDNEPDYSFVLRFNSRMKFHPVRYDFLNLIGLGMAQKATGGEGTYNLGIMQPKYWFEVTNTALFRVTQFEYDNNEREAAPYILQGGVMEQWVLGQNNGANNNITYFHVGGNVWFNEFHRGTHQDKQMAAKHPPVSVTGGDFNQFHLTGLYRADVDIFDDNAECYINGGRFKVVAGTGMDGIGHPTNRTNGNITWVIDHADIDEFYAGSFNAAQPAQGNLHTTIRHSYVRQFVGGPKFGDMNEGRTVTTNADSCHFVLFFGAGYGGNSYNRQVPYNANNKINIEWNQWIEGTLSFIANGATSTTVPNSLNPNFNGYHQEYKSAYDGVSTQISYQFIPMSGNVDNCARLWIEYVKFSLATTHGVTSYLKHCTIDSNFYGGGSLGKVEGNVLSTLDSCTVMGNVFGAGYSATTPKIPVMNTGGFKIEPKYDNNLGTYLNPTFPDIVNYDWKYDASYPATGHTIDKDKHIIYTNEDLSALGTVQGNDTIILKGNTTVGTTLPDGTLKSNTGNVFGGGDMSGVTQATNNGNPVAGTGNTTVILQESTNVLGNVYGGGNRGAVGGNSEVKIQDE